MNSEEVRERWVDRSGEYSPRYYAYYGPNETSDRIRARLDAHVDPDATVLELGCSSGRHLHHLLEHGYGNLHGIDVNADAFEVMANAYPDLAARGTFYADAIGDAVVGFDDGQFDAVYSVETLQHLHPDDEWVFEELSRITDDLLLTVENEGEDDRRQSDGIAMSYVGDVPLYYRDWRRVFTERGFVEFDSEQTGRDVFRAFWPT